MMPVVRSACAHRRQSVAYAGLTAGVSVVPFLTGAAGVVYLVGALLLGGGLVAVTLLDLRTDGWTRRVFAFSITYLAATFALLALTAAL